MMGVAIGAVLGVTLCVVKCQGSRVCPCLCGEEAREEKETLAEEEDIIGDEAASVGGRKTEEGETAAVVEVDGEAKDLTKEEEEEVGGAVPAMLKSLSVNLLGLLGMSASDAAAAGDEEEKEKKKKQTELLEMARGSLEEESKQNHQLVE